MLPFLGERNPSERTAIAALPTPVVARATLHRPIAISCFEALGGGIGGGEAWVARMNEETLASIRKQLRVRLAPYRTGDPWVRYRLNDIAWGELTSLSRVRCAQAT